MGRYSTAWPRWHARFAAIVLTAHFLVGLALAESPQLHKLLHNDAASPNHVCFVTILATGGCDAPSVPLVVAPALRAALLEELTPEPRWIESACFEEAFPARAPPALLS